MRLPVRVVEKESGGFCIVESGGTVVVAEIEHEAGCLFVKAANAYGTLVEIAKSALPGEAAKAELHYLGEIA